MAKVMVANNYGFVHQKFSMDDYSVCEDKLSFYNEESSNWIPGPRISRNFWLIAKKGCICLAIDEEDGATMIEFSREDKDVILLGEFILALCAGLYTYHT